MEYNNRRVHAIPYFTGEDRVPIRYPQTDQPGQFSACYHFRIWYYFYYLFSLSSPLSSRFSVTDVMSIFRKFGMECSYASTARNSLHSHWEHTSTKTGLCLLCACLLPPIIHFTLLLLLLKCYCLPAPSIRHSHQRPAICYV